MCLNIALKHIKHCLSEETEQPAAPLSGLLCLTGWTNNWTLSELQTKPYIYTLKITADENLHHQTERSCWWLINCTCKCNRLCALVGKSLVKFLNLNFSRCRYIGHLQHQVSSNITKTNNIWQLFFYINLCILSRHILSYGEPTHAVIYWIRYFQYWKEI